MSVSNFYEPQSWADNILSEFDAPHVNDSNFKYGFDSSPLSPRTDAVLENFIDVSINQNQNQHYLPNLPTPSYGPSSSIYSQLPNTPDSGYNDTQELSDDTSSPASSPDCESQWRLRRSRSAKKPYEPQTERRGRGRPLKVDEGPSDVMQKRFYARSYREKQKKGQTQLTKVVIELYNAYTKGETIDPQTLEFAAELAKKHCEKC